MQYRTIGNEKVSILGYGTMRLPRTEEDKIDRPKAAELLDKALKSGVNYFDTAYPYHHGESEVFVGEWMKTHDRSSFHVATKLPVWLINSLEDAEKMFDLQMSHLQTDYIDFFLLHALNKQRWKNVCSQGLLEWAGKLKKEGKIRNLGFSFHDDYEVFEEILNSYNWDFCQIQLNYMDADFQAGLKGLKLAKEKGIPVVVMEPAKGGMLSKVTENAEKRFKSLYPDRTPSHWALRWVEAQEGVAVVLSGMNTHQQLDDNLKMASEASALSEEEKAAIEYSASQFRERIQVACTGCQYCLPCTMGIDIPAVFKLYNNTYMFSQDKETRRKKYEDIKVKASACINCHKCMTQCPQHLNIPQYLKDAESYLL